jgi:hypothetical protein
MDSKGFKHQNGNSVCRDEDCTSLKAFSERRKNKLQENAFVKVWDPIQKNTQSQNCQIFPNSLRPALLVDSHFATLSFFSSSKREGNEQKVPKYVLRIY